MSKYFLPLALGALTLTGCRSLAPKYERPAAPVAPAWPTNSVPASAVGNATNTANIGWREFFTDAQLQKLIELALANNRDLRIALLNVEQSRAQYRIQKAAQFPEIDLNASMQRQRIPAGVTGFAGPLNTTQYNVNVGVASYELDLFGRVRNLKEQALEQYLATDEIRKSATLALVAEIATQYLTLRELDDQLQVARQTLETVQSYRTLTKRIFDAGSTSELDLRSAEAQVETARANVANYTRLRAQAENALVLLVGQPLPPNLPAAKTLSAQEFLADLPAGLPSDLLQQRPDIIAAEHQLKAANANIGAARAAFYPSILLTGAAGSSSVQLQDLFSAGTAAWNFSPQIKLPIFTGGSAQANFDVTKISKQIDVARYEKTIQTAFREVADALVGRTTLAEQIQALEALVKAQQQRYQVSEVRYRTGVDNYLALLIAQQDLYNAQQSLIQARFSRLANLITLYQALGGGWHEHTVKKSP